MTSPCAPWCTAEQVAACGSVACDDSGGSTLDDMISVASYVLWLLSRKRYPGICDALVQPYAASCREECCLSGVNRSWGFESALGWCCGTHGLPSCSACISKRSLGKYPVREITSVEIDGDVLDASEYRLVGKRWLVRMADADGNRQAWPVTNRLDLPLGEDGTWSVAFTYGTNPPIAGQMAAAELARQLCLACSPDDDACQLPANVTTLVRQGVTTVTDLAALFEGRTGLDICDRWLAAERYADREAGARVYNPDDFERVTSLPVSAS